MGEKEGDWLANRLLSWEELVWGYCLRIGRQWIVE